MFTHSKAAAIVAVVGGLLVTACGDDDAATSDASNQETSTSSAAEPVVDPGDGGDYQPQIDSANFVESVDNPYLPLVPGTGWVYEGEGDEGESERIEVTVTDERREVMGISATVVRDSVYADGELIEDTWDWYAQDRDGNVWYLGEDTAEYENGEVVNTEGAWEAGVDGALPGIVMPADPQVGDSYRQEYYAGEAEDMFEVTEVGASRTVPAGSYEDVLVTTDWTPLEPEVVEQKSYAPGIGVIAEEKTEGGTGYAELVEFTPPS
jgi:hypothetical protein